MEREKKANVKKTKTKKHKLKAKTKTKKQKVKVAKTRKQKVKTKKQKVYCQVCMCIFIFFYFFFVCWQCWLVCVFVCMRVCFFSMKNKNIKKKKYIWKCFACCQAKHLRFALFFWKIKIKIKIKIKTDFMSPKRPRAIVSALCFYEIILLQIWILNQKNIELLELQFCVCVFFFSFLTKQDTKQNKIQNKTVVWFFTRLY